MRWRAWTWMLFAACLLALTVGRFWPDPPIETDLLTLLPPTERNPLVERAMDQIGRLAGERAVFLVGATDPRDAQAAAAFLTDRLESGRLFRRVISRVPEPDPTALLNLYAPYRNGLATLPDGREAYSTVLQSRLANPFGAGALPLASDPFGLFDTWLDSLPFQQFRMRPEAGWLTVRGNGETWVLVSAELKGSAFDPSLQLALEQLLTPAEQELRKRWQGIQLLRAGAIFHATAARTSAESEMHLIGLGSLLAIVLLLTLTYRSPAPLALGLLSVCVGLCAAALLTLAVFGRLHLMTLVFGASLIGEAVDYAIQYFSARLGAGKQWDSRQGLKSILPAISIALATSVVGYAALAFTPFSALRQIAVFAIGGLVAAWLTVLMVLPWWLRRPQKTLPGTLLHLPLRWLDLWRRRVSPRGVLVVAILVLAASAPGWLQVKVNDDVRQLIQPPPEIERQEARLRELTGLGTGSQFFLVEGKDAEQALRREEALARRLQAEGVPLQGVSRFVPSCARQTENRAELRAASPEMARALDEAGFRPDATREWIAAVNADPGCLTPEAWLASPISTPFRHLWLESGEGRGALISLPAGNQQVDLLAAAAQQGVTLVDKAGAVSRLFGEYRRLAVYVLAAATLLILAVLAWRYGPRSGAAILLPTLLGQALAIGMLGYTGIALNLFNVLAVLLILGVGINYGIFLVEGMRGGGLRESAAFIGVILSSLTTLISFGLLGFSSMPALSGFGITLATGIGLAVLVSPAAQVLTEHVRDKAENRN